MKGDEIMKTTEKKFRWLIYGQLGTFMWHKKLDPKRINDPKGHYIADSTVLEVDNMLTRLEKARACGADTVLFDIGEAIQYPSHPELWIDGCLSADKARGVVERMKAMGYEVIPSLNFSTDHHHWLCEYQRMVSTPEYYRVCEDVIRDTWEICGHPEVFHLGYDEENIDCTFSHAKDYSAAVTVRQGTLYWHDLNWFCDVCRKLGSRPSFWLDSQRRSNYSHEEFVKNIGRDEKDDRLVGLILDIARNLKVDPPMSNVEIRMNNQIMGEEFRRWAEIEFSPEGDSLDRYLSREMLQNRYNELNKKYPVKSQQFKKKLEAFCKNAEHVEALNPKELKYYNEKQGRILIKSNGKLDEYFYVKSYDRPLNDTPPGDWIPAP